MANTTLQLTELEVLLRKAAELSAGQDIPSETFMAAAFNAYLEARPGLREELEDKELKTQLRKLRKQGLIAMA